MWKLVHRVVLPRKRQNSQRLQLRWLPKQLWHSYCWPLRQRTAADASQSMREEAMLLLLRGVGASTLPLHWSASSPHRRMREQSPGRCETGVRCIPTSRGVGVEVVVDSIRSCSAVLDAPSTRRPRPHAGRPGGRQRRVRGQVPESHFNRVRNRALSPRLGQGRHRSTRRKVSRGGGLGIFANVGSNAGGSYAGVSRGSTKSSFLSFELTYMQ